MRVIIEPALEPISLADVKVQQGIKSSDTSQDSIIRRRILQARMYAENYMQRALITQTQEVRLDGFPVGEIQLPFPNLLSIVSIKYIDSAGGEQTINNSLYAVDTYSALGSVFHVFGTAWPIARDEKNAVRIQYTCGYGPSADSVPDLIKEALLLTVGNWMNFQPQAESGVSMSRIPYAVRDILDLYAIRLF